jgi:2-phosphosulfolactate phosphatase
MSMTIEALLSPAEYQARRARGFAGEVCVVFDVLRATSVIVTGLARGANGFIPVEEISEVVALQVKHPGALLAGEREGLRITAAQSGGVEFDLGNSPREFTASRVADKTIITTTTNGTRALRACETADAVVVASFLNLTATASWIQARGSVRVVLVCAGTGEAAALEDILCAGALCERLMASGKVCEVADSAEVARRTFIGADNDLTGAMRHARNGMRLLANPELCDDVAFCLQRDLFGIVGLMNRDGIIRRA